MPRKFTEEPNFPTCITCPFWSQRDGDYSGVDQDHEVGNCLRFPPQSVNLEQEGTRKMLQRWDWPVTENWQTCGEHPAYPTMLEL